VPNSGTYEKGMVVILGVLLALVLSFFVSVPVYAQVTGATLSGTITDPSGGVVPGAQISIRNTATGITKDATTDSAGFYTVPNLAAGTYEVKVRAHHGRAIEPYARRGGSTIPQHSDEGRRDISDRPSD
jgi:hypothetical protein